MAAPKALWFTTDEEACRLLADDPFALLVGFALDQQVTVPTAFAGPQKIKQRLGTLDPATVARTDLVEIFKQKPAVHRFPGAMAQRVQELAQHVVDQYDGDAARLWREAKDSDDLKKRRAPPPRVGGEEKQKKGAGLSEEVVEA